ncbi:uncharacterized protein KQ657_004328 [Scheffersomyces spartinae]|uniref:Pre-mRNA-processing factor 39 n=1 Tax=Scheffersomyces spartinae TaxID=45513 RepID=A0A9P7VB32_9ASCO|nr:uncharacterized protein KQ657_004328 [Scheffersomyces spartinae]KAG7194652.1 hypothetical protein KQ657_004328 [Scheffersomyces spartinae]
MNSFRPIDLVRLSNKNELNANIPHERLKLQINENPMAISGWDQLFRLIDDTVAQLYDKSNTDAINSQFKQFIHNTYSEFLARFPCAESYWQKWLVIEYKLHNDKSKSIAVLKNAVDLVPGSLALWNDYLDILIDDYENCATPTIVDQKLELLRSEFPRAVSAVGWHFNADTLWDKIIQFELKLQLQSQEALAYYKQVVRIPLYEYSRYYMHFTEFIKQFDLEKSFDLNIFAPHFSTYGVTSVEQLTNEEKKTIVDSHYESLFQETQKWVTAVWPFESQITRQFFIPTEIEVIAQETSKWIEYLDAIILLHKESPTPVSFDFVSSIFERSLIPNCYNENLWLKYIAFINKYEVDEKAKDIKLTSIFNRASTLFIPLEETELRSLYIKYLSSTGGFSLANEYCFEWIKNLDGSTFSRYLKKPYLAFVGYLIDLWENHMSSVDLCLITLIIIIDFFDKVDSYNKKQEIKLVDSSLKKNSKFDYGYVNTLSKVLNASSICIIVSKHLHLLLKSQGPESYKAIRSFYNKYHEEDALKGSTKFWKFMVEHEGIIKFNINNLRSIIKFIKTKTNLPKSSVDALTDLVYDIYTSNYDAVLAVGQIDDTVVRHWNDVDNSLSINTDAFLRFSENNYLVDDIVSSKRPPVRLSKEEELKRLYKLNIGNPGIMVDKSPNVVNSLIFDGKHISLVDIGDGNNTEKLVPPETPMFRNVEKANQAIEYPKYLNI